MLKRTPLLDQLADFIWELWCIVSVIGLWPRYIEPRLLSRTHKVFNLNFDQKIKILHFSDLHINSQLSSRVLKKILKIKQRWKPDLIALRPSILAK